MSCIVSSIMWQDVVDVDYHHLGKTEEKNDHKS